MLKEQRQQIIVDYLRRHQFGKIEDFAKLTESSEITVRRDINELHTAMRVEKVHGGAQSIRNSYFDIELKQRSTKNVDVKDRIGKEASLMVEEGMSVYLDAGTTCAAMIPYLKGKDITVITHGVHHIQDLAKAGLKVHLIGGDIKKETLACVGSVALSYLSQMRFDICFLGSNAVDAEFGHSTPDVNEAMMKQMIIRNSDVSVVLVDSSKFNLKSKVSFADNSHLIITDLNVSEDYNSFKIKSV